MMHLFFKSMLNFGAKSASNTPNWEGKYFSKLRTEVNVSPSGKCSQIKFCSYKCKCSQDQSKIVHKSKTQS